MNGIENVHFLNIETAWNAGCDGRKVIDRIISDAKEHLKKEGRIVLVQSSLADIEKTIDVLEENYKAAPNSDVSRAEIYQSYKEWCEKYGFHPLNNANFGKEIRRIFPGVKTIRKQGEMGNRFRVYQGIAQRND